MYKRIVSTGLLLGSLLGIQSSVNAQDPTTQGPLQNDPSLAIYGYGTGSSGGGGYYPSAGSAPKVVYLPSKYGAVVYNPKTGRWDSAFGLSSKRAALKEATHKCEANGNAPCNQIFLTYRNGCGAMAEGGIEKKWKIYADAGETSKEAERLALKKCSDDGAADCKIIMPAECSLP